MNPPLKVDEVTVGGRPAIIRDANNTVIALVPNAYDAFEITKLINQTQNVHTTKRTTAE